MNEIPSFALDSVAILTEKNIFSGVNGLFEPNVNTDRAQTAEVVYRMMKALNWMGE
ncbi:S-layer homology domain-containing protein [Paenibacillus wynnii]|uniref:S-layer homology domain-containing protein n=1 Tax=Paenibacillus wynnii TaxID=268407 RepID=UPI0009FCA9B7|nr:S-layer homology domain-containing protein [Paenibacillus wynnii]